MTMQNAKYNGVTLVLLIISEILALAAIRAQAWFPFGVLALITGAIIVLVWIKSRQSPTDFKLKNVTLRKMLANAISPTWLGVAYLMAFVLHIGWTSNALNSLFVGKEDLPQAITSFGLSVIALVVLIVFFPEGKVDKSSAKKVVFISGISIIAVNKAKNDDKKRIISIRNIVPLVSVLDLVLKGSAVKRENVGGFLILDTDGHQKTGADRLSLMDVIDKNDWDNSYLDIGMDGKPDIIPLPWRPASGAEKDVESLIVWLIKFTAKLKYPGNDAFIDGLKINFMDKPCDFDQFDQCFKVVKDAVDNVDDREHLLYFNLTPGTGIVGSLMTLFAIDDNRRLYYYPQNTTRVITEADKNKVPLENLLSQALENIRNE